MGHVMGDLSEGQSEEDSLNVHPRDFVPHGLCSETSSGSDDDTVITVDSGDSDCDCSGFWYIYARHL